METGEIIEDICRQGVLTNAYLLFGGTLPNFHRGKKNNFGQHFRQGSQLVAYYSTTGRNVKNQKHKTYALSDYIHPKFDGIPLRSYGGWLVGWS